MTKAMEMERRRREKEQMVSSWEEIFKVEVNKVLSPISLKVLWDDDTSCSEACALLTVAAVVSGPTPSEEPKKGKDSKKKKDTDFNVYDTNRQAFVLFGYSSYDEAFEEAKNYCLENGVKLSDVKVCQIYE